LLQLDEESDEGSGSPASRHSAQTKGPGTVPHGARAFLCLPWHRVLVVIGGVVGLVAQMLLLQLGWQLWDLSVSLMEVWAELARKHLEITLSK
jgi:hypothetical protein